MGYHTYNLAEFRMSAVGRHQTYILYFTEHYPAAQFAEAIGSKSVAVSNSVNTVDWMFRHELPPWMAQKFFSHETVLFCSQRKRSLDVILQAYKEIASWRSEQLDSLDTKPRPNISITDIADILLLIIPVYNRHAYAVDTIAQMIHTGLIGNAISEGRLSELCSRIKETTEIETYLYKNTMLVDLVYGDLRSESTRHIIAKEFYDELRSIKDIVVDLPQSRDTNELLRQLALVRKDVSDAVQKQHPLTVQASLGFEAFGNGVKLLFDSQGISTQPLNKASVVFGRLSSLINKQE